jgi:hypothetical protein
MHRMPVVLHAYVSTWDEHDMAYLLRRSAWPWAGANCPRAAPASRTEAHRRLRGEGLRARPRQKPTLHKRKQDTHVNKQTLVVVTVPFTRIALLLSVWPENAQTKCVGKMATIRHWKRYAADMYTVLDNSWFGRNWKCNQTQLEIAKGIAIPLVCKEIRLSKWISNVSWNTS